MEFFRNTIQRPAATYRVLVTVLVVGFLCSAIGATSTPSRGGLYYVGATSWAVFIVTLAVTAVFTIVLLVTRSGRRTSPKEQP